MITPDGVVKVLDFGVGLILDDVHGEPLTSCGVAIGTAQYMSPEQAKAEAVTPATDLYALGCVLYEMLTGASPFDGETAYELMSQQVEQAPLLVSSLRSEVPEALGQLVSRLLEKDPADRPQTPSRSRPPCGRSSWHPVLQFRDRTRRGRSCRPMLRKRPSPAFHHHVRGAQGGCRR